MGSPRLRIQGKKGHYLVLALLSKGGMATLHLARKRDEDGPDRFVVIKQLLPRLQQEPRIVELFLNEARTLSRFDHPNVIRVHEIGKTKTSFFIIMEYLLGESLGYLHGSAIRRHEAFPPSLAASIVAQICDGLEYAHRAVNPQGMPLGILHQSITPQNIIVLHTGRVKLINFRLEKGAIQIPEISMSAYLSPEQCLGKPASVQSDIFSVGVVLWELLAQQHLFKRKTDPETRLAVASTDVRPLQKIRAGVPEELQNIAFRALRQASQPAYGSAGELGEALRGYLRSTGSQPEGKDLKTFFDKYLGERTKNKLSHLAQVEGSDEEPVDLALLLPNVGSSLPLASEAPLPKSSGPRLPDKPTPPSTPPPPSAPGEVSFTDETVQLDPATAARLKAAVEATAELSEKRVVQESGGEASTVEFEKTPLHPMPLPGKPRRVRRNWLWILLGLVVGAGATLGLVLWPSSPAPRPQPPVTEKPIRSEEPSPVADAGTKVQPEPEREPVPAPKPPSVAAPRFGKLNLNTEPWTEVTLGGRKLGITPLLGVKLPPGKHTLTLSNQGEGINSTLTITIQAGKTTTLTRNLSNP